jgi:hypothetical protein
MGKREKTDKTQIGSGPGRIDFISINFVSKVVWVLNGAVYCVATPIPTYPEHLFLIHYDPGAGGRGAPTGS